MTTRLTPKIITLIEKADKLEERRRRANDKAVAARTQAESEGHADEAQKLSDKWLKVTKKINKLADQEAAIIKADRRRKVKAIKPL